MSSFPCFTMIARTGSRVCVDRSLAEGIAWLEPAGNDSVPLLLCFSANTRRTGHLLAADGEAFTVSGELLARPAFTVRLDVPEPGGETEILHASSTHFRMSFAEPEQAPIVFSRRDRDQGYCFSIVPFEPLGMSHLAVSLNSEIGAAITMPMRWEPVLGKLKAGLLRPALAEIVLRLLPVDELVSLARHFIETPEELGLLQSASPADPWLTERLPHLMAWIAEGQMAAEPVAAEKPFWHQRLFGHAAWRRGAGSPGDRKKPRQVECSAGTAGMDDLPGVGRTTSHRADFGLALTAAMRLQTRPKAMACVLACARNEGPYLLDWIAYHKSIGFDHAFIYSNDNTDGSDRILELLAGAGEIHWMNNEVSPGTLPQFKAYAHALSVLPEILDYRWTLIADLDEYFGFDSEKFVSVSDFLEWQEMRQADAVALPWLIHVARLHDGWSDRPCVTRFPMREITVNHHVKSVFRTNRMWSSNPHHPDASHGSNMRFLAETGLPHIPLPPQNSPGLSCNPLAHNAWVSHYILRSAPEALQKIYRGRGDGGDRGWDHAARQRMARIFLQLATATQLVREPRMAKCARRMDGELARLRDIAGIRACDASIKERFAQEMRSACKQVLAEPIAPQEIPEWLGFRDVLKALH